MPVQWITAPAVCEYFRDRDQKPITLRTLHRWIEAGVIHRPVKINNRNYFRPEWLDEVTSRKEGAA